MKKLLDAGYLEEWSYHQTLSGVPQGSIVSPILSTILLDKRDTFVETVLIPQHTRGKKSKANKQYTHLLARAKGLFKQGQKEAAQRGRRQGHQLPSYDPQDPNYRRLRYCRYADDFVLGFTGPKSEAEEIKEQLRTFLREELKLELSEEKTLITHASSGAARLLGYEITVRQENRKGTKNRASGTKRRSINGHSGLRVPRTVLVDKCTRYKKRNKVMPRAELLNESDYPIISTYQLEFQGIANYYQLAYNMHTLHYLRWVMDQWLPKRLARKHHPSVQHICDQYKAELLVDGVISKGLRVIVPRDGKKPLVATWGGIPLAWDIQANLEDQPQRRWNRRSELEQRLLAQVCEQCGATFLTDYIQVHHIRALKDLTKYEGRQKPLWVKIRAARRRKTLLLCRTCHQDLHAGRPLRRQKSSS